jgi:large subunit ribosomal protein L4
MANVDVLNLNGEKVGSIELADALFAPDQVNEALLWEAVKHYRASLRQGTAATKSRTKVAGSGKKLWKQKGTGRARIGSVRSALWRHGYTVHGPQPRSYDYAFPRKKMLGALRSAIASKLADGGGHAGVEGAEDQALSRSAGQAGRDAHSSAGGERQDAHPRIAAGRAQPGGC